jgi:hypothetical protein
LRHDPREPQGQVGEAVRQHADRGRHDEGRLVWAQDADVDNAGWRSEASLAEPDGLRLVFQPAYAPEEQPAETLRTLVDEPAVNKHIPTLEALDEIISARCAVLASKREKIRGQAGFRWWPKIANPR